MTEFAGLGSPNGEQLRLGRVAAGLTQEELAERSGVSVRAISDLERGRIRRPRRDTVRRLTLALRPQPSDDVGAGPGALNRPAQLPVDLADFTGRASEVRQLTALGRAAMDEAGRAAAVWAIAGAGGIGKTALAVRAAHLLAPQFPDGQLYLNLRGSGAQPLSTGAALAALLRGLGENGQPGEDEEERAARFRSRTAGRRLLVLLDDAGDAAQVRLLLPGSSTNTVLITSRQSLPDLEPARQVALETLPEADAAELFARIVGRPKTETESEAAAAVLQACGGLPLAIRIAAARLAARPGWTVAALADRLGDARRRLDELHAGDLAVRASFMVSYSNARLRQGSPGREPDRVFRLLGLADGPDISLGAAAALIGVPPQDAEQPLEQLVDAHLLESARPGRYRFHDLLRLYASERAEADEDAPERQAAVGRLLGWYLCTATAAARLVNPRRRHVEPRPPASCPAPLEFADYDDAMTWLDAEYANLVAAVSLASAHGEREVGWQLPVTLWDLFVLRGNLDDWIATHETGLACVQSLGDRAAELWVLNNLAGGYFQAGRADAAIGCMTRVVAAARDAGTPAQLAIAQHNLGAALASAGRMEEAALPLTEALAAHQLSGNQSAIGGIQLILGYGSRQRKNYDQAVEYLQQAAANLGAAGETSKGLEALVELSAVHLEQGLPDVAAREAAAARASAAKTGNRSCEARALAVLGRADRELGRTQEARAHLALALETFTDLGSIQDAAAVAASLDDLPPHSAGAGGALAGG